MKLKYDKPLSNFAFKFNLRRYNLVSVTTYEQVELEVWTTALHNPIPAVRSTGLIN